MSESVTSANLGTVDILRIMQMIPHRYPMLLIDRLINISGDESGTGVKNVTINEPFFQGHFPGQPVMPGVLIIESMAQTAGALVVNSMGAKAEGKLVYFMAVDDARFRKPVVPGDQLHIEVKKDRSRGAVWRYAARALVDGQLVAEATITAMIRGV